MILKGKWMILLCLSLLLAGCSGAKPAAEPPAMAEQSDYIFGTLVSLKLYEPVEASVYQAVFDDLRDVENRMTVKGITSELIAVNAAAGTAPVAVSADTFEVLEAAEKYAALSEGAFDATVYPLVALWGIGTDLAQVPSPEEIEVTRQAVGYQDLVLDKAKGTAFLKRPGMGLDLGGIAKGYAADRTARKLKALGVDSGIINLGGNVLALGAKADGSPWRIGIQNPMSDRGEYLGIAAVTNKTVVTSGIYERYFEQEGIRYHHILDPHTGYPSDNNLAGVSILTDSSMDADALSTACFVLGPEKALALAKSLPGVEVLFITKDKKVLMTEGFKAVFTQTDDSFTVVDAL